MGNRQPQSDARARKHLRRARFEARVAAQSAFHAEQRAGAAHVWASRAGVGALVSLVVAMGTVAGFVLR